MILPTILASHTCPVCHKPNTLQVEAIPGSSTRFEFYRVTCSASGTLGGCGISYPVRLEPQQSVEALEDTALTLSIGNSKLVNAPQAMTHSTTENSSTL
jgi:hypothetical protein